MRLLKQVPEAEEKIKSGDLSLSVMAQAQKFFRQEKKLGHEVAPEKKKEVVASLEGKSLRESEKTLLALSQQPERHRPETVRPVTPELSEVKFLANEELLKDLEQLKGLLAHSHPDLSLADLIAFSAKRALKDLDPAQKEVQKKQQPQPQPGQPPIAPLVAGQRKAIPAAVKREVWKRDGSSCSYVDPQTSKRCGSRFALEIDHRHPVGLSGGNNIENLRLLCAQHNAWADAQVYGREKIQPYWNASHSRCPS